MKRTSLVLMLAGLAVVVLAAACGGAAGRPTGEDPLDGT